ncbi:MAG: antitoxin Xre/MbcA/ParS toxin-binding domain-containing protein [Niabella sp.]
MKKKKYLPPNTTASTLQEAAVAYIPKIKNNAETFRSKNYMQRALALMGMPENKPAISTNTDFISLIRAGVSKKSLDYILTTTGITAVEMAGIIHTTDRTLRRYTSTQRLNPEQSERVIELATLYARGEEVFEGLNNFKLWMNTPVIALDNKKPKDFLDTSIGINYLLNELGRIEHGIFA